jgi:hypothetical protein
VALRVSVFIKAGENTPTPPLWGKKILANVVWGKKYEKVKSKRGKFKEREKKKEEKGKKMKKGEVKG